MDMLDPFSTFHTEVKSALPETSNPATEPAAADDASAAAATIFDLAPKAAAPAAPREIMRSSLVPTAPPQAMNGYGAPPQAVNPWGQPPPQPQAPPAAVPPPAAAPGAMVPSATPSADPYGLGAFGAPAAPAPAAPAPVAPQPAAYAPYGQPAPAQAPPAYAAAPPAPVAAPPAPVAAPPAPESYSAPAPTTETLASAYAPDNSDPFGVFSNTPASAAVVPAAPADDPFGVYGGGAPAAAPAPPPEAAPVAPPVAAPAPPVPAAASDDDFFGDFFANQTKAPEPVAAPEAAPEAAPRGLSPTAPGDGPVATPASVPGLPEGGKTYTATVDSGSLGVVFFEAKSLKKTIFHQGGYDVDDIGARPAVAFMVTDSAARKAGVKVGHVLLSINGRGVTNPKEANKTIKETTERPLQLSMWIPNFEIMFAEGMHMVKYDERTGLAPLRPQDWKPKFIVIGGVIGYHWQMKMYRSQREYDTAVMETFNHHPVSVKVKDFGIHHTCRLNQPEVRKIHYKTYEGTETWYYIAMKSPTNNCIKISSKNIEDLKPITAGIKAVIKTCHQDKEFEIAQTGNYSTTTDGHVRNPHVHHEPHSYPSSGYGY